MTHVLKVLMAYAYELTDIVKKSGLMMTKII